VSCPCTCNHTPPRCLSHHPHEDTSHNCTFTLYPIGLGIHVGPCRHQQHLCVYVCARSRLLSVCERVCASQFHARCCSSNRGTEPCPLPCA
jgi:hypothetical protein